MMTISGSDESGSEYSHGSKESELRRSPRSHKNNHESQKDKLPKATSSKKGKNNSKETKDNEKTARISWRSEVPQGNKELSQYGATLGECLLTLIEAPENSTVIRGLRGEIQSDMESLEPLSEGKSQKAAKKHGGESVASCCRRIGKTLFIDSDLNFDLDERQAALKVRSELNNKKKATKSWIEKLEQSGGGIADRGVGVEDYMVEEDARTATKLWEAARSQIYEFDRWLTFYSGQPDVLPPATLNATDNFIVRSSTYTSGKRGKKRHLSVDNADSDTKSAAPDVKPDLSALKAQSKRSSSTSGYSKLTSSASAAAGRIGEAMALAQDLKYKRAALKADAVNQRTQAALDTWKQVELEKAETARIVALKDHPHLLEAYFASKRPAPSILPAPTYF